MVGMKLLDVPDELLIAVFSLLPLPWLFGPGAVFCRKVAELAIKFKKRRIQREQNNITQAAGGYSSDNVTTICLFYNLLSQLRSNSSGAQLQLNEGKYLILKDGDNHGSLRDATLDECETITRACWPSVSDDPTVHNLFSGSQRTITQTHLSLLVKSNLN